MFPSSKNTVYALRLHPNQKLVEELKIHVEKHHLEAVSVITVVGSLKNATIRFANQDQLTHLPPNPSIGKKLETYEIVSLVGTIAKGGKPHLHISLGDGQGNTISGHLVEGIIYTTAEITLMELEDLVFLRKYDPDTGYDELEIKERNS